MLTGDLGEAALLARAGRLDDAAPRWFVPLRSMLATPVADAAEAVARLGEDVWVEDKYDGIRCQLHRRGDDAALYSRDLKNISAQFPEITEAAVHLSADVMLDGEILAFHDGRVMPFHALQTRLGRVSPDAERDGGGAGDLRRVGRARWSDDEVLIDRPLRERRARLEALAVPHPLALAHLERVHGEAEIDRRFDDARARLNEGLLLKQPESTYTPGRRGLNWLKLKRPLDTLDVVVVGAEWGHGKRRGVLSDVTFAVRVDDTDELATIGKAYTGLTDAEIAEMTALLLDITISDHGHYRTVEPRIVLEIAFDAVQFSARHNSGFALRFPRIARWRHDKPVRRDRHAVAGARHRHRDRARPCAARRPDRRLISCAREMPRRVPACPSPDRRPGRRRRTVRAAPRTAARARGRRTPPWGPTDAGSARR